MPFTVAKIKGIVQHYEWGGVEYIPQLLNLSNSAKRPYAEYWLGAHSSAPAWVMINNAEEKLTDLIQKNSINILSQKVSKRYGNIPFLLKILDVRSMLSIQLHPALDAAKAGYDEEDLLGIPLNDPKRNYKDKNHKPETTIALSEFWLLHGFKPPTSLELLLNEPLFAILAPVYQKKGLTGLYHYVMRLEQQEVDELLLPVVHKAVELKKQGLIQKNDPEWWVAQLFNNKEINIPLDRGIFSIYFLNIVKLLPDESVFQPAGIPHAYLEGQCVELMANSDNVLRGGLTPKHVDVDELLKHIVIKGDTPKFVKPVAITNQETVYLCPIDEFGISKIVLRASETYTRQSTAVEIWLLLSGSLVLNDTLELLPGESVIIAANTSCYIKAQTDLVLFRAFVPD